MDKIDLFWSDFSKTIGEIGNEPDNNTLISKLDKIVHDLDERLDWEYGPQGTFEFYFALSPNLQEDLLDFVELVIEKAPVIEGWKIISGKPKKDDVLEKFQLQNANNIITIDTKKWECVIYKFPDKTYDIDIKLNDDFGDENLRYLAVDIHFINLIGEKNYLSLIQNLQLVSEFEDKASGRSVLVNDIAKYLRIH